MKSKRIVIHQPNFLPWLGFFHKVSMGDEFIILDDVQYSKRSFQNRNKVMTAHGPKWLTVPVVASERGFPAINEVMISYERDWVSEHLKTLEQSYVKTPYFAAYMELMHEAYGSKFAYLAELNIFLLTKILYAIQLDVPVYYSSALDIDETAHSTERLLQLCEAREGTAYISGLGAKKYQDELMFNDRGIELEYAEFTPFPYPQQHRGEFVPGLAIVDYLFNCGGDSLLPALQSAHHTKSSARETVTHGGA